MRRRLLVGLITATIFALAAGKWLLQIAGKFSDIDVLGRAPSAWQEAMNWLDEFDFFLINHNIHPFLVALGLVVLLSGWVVPDLWPHLWNRLSPKVSLLVEFHHSQLPTMVPPAGILCTMTLLGDERGFEPLYLSERHGDPGARWEWVPSGWEPYSTQKCTITSYANEPIFGVVVVFKVEYREEIPDTLNPAATRSGNVVVSWEREIPISKLEPKKAFEFFIYNQGNKFACVHFPSAATFQRAGSGRREAAHFLPQMTMIGMLSPWRRRIAA